MENNKARDGAASALDLVNSSRAQLADRLVTPWWYHPALGLLVGGLTASFVFDSLIVTAIALVLYGLGLWALVTSYRRLTGVWVNGFRAGRASRWGVALGVVAGAAVLGGVFLDRVAGWDWALLVVGVLLVPVVIVLGRQFDRTLRAELRGQQ